MFKRAKVIDIITRDEKYNPGEVMIHFIDEGSVDKFTVILISLIMLITQSIFLYLLLVEIIKFSMF